MDPTLFDVFITDLKKKSEIIISKVFRRHKASGKRPRMLLAA